MPKSTAAKPVFYMSVKPTFGSKGGATQDVGARGDVRATLHGRVDHAYLPPSERKLQRAISKMENLDRNTTYKEYCAALEAIAKTSDDYVSPRPIGWLDAVTRVGIPLSPDRFAVLATVPPNRVQRSEFAAYLASFPLLDNEVVEWHASGKDIGFFYIVSVVGAWDEKSESWPSRHCYAIALQRSTNSMFVFEPDTKKPHDVPTSALGDYYVERIPRALALSHNTQSFGYRATGQFWQHVYIRQLSRADQSKNYRCVHRTSVMFAYAVRNLKTMINTQQAREKWFWKVGDVRGKKGVGLNMDIKKRV